MSGLKPTQRLILTQLCKQHVIWHTSRGGNSRDSICLLPVISGQITFSLCAPTIVVTTFDRFVAAGYIKLTHEYDDQIAAHNPAFQYKVYTITGLGRKALTPKRLKRSA